MKTYVQRSIILGVLAMSLLNAACSVVGIRNEETPGYAVVLAEDNKEIRAYDSYVMAQTVVQGEYDESSSKAFRILFDYISGANQASEKISMTAPVTKGQSGEKIEMTAPVIQGKSGDSVDMTAPVTQGRTGGGWSMAFVLPSKYDFNTAPRPTDPRVELVQIPARTMAALRYRGFTSPEKIVRLGTELMAWSEQNGYLPVAAPASARYDPPWTIPFLRRNEVLVEVER
jgi:hypothetical protein